MLRFSRLLVVFIPYHIILINILSDRPYYNHVSTLP
jgi:hypothetical protein